MPVVYHIPYERQAPPPRNRGIPAFLPPGSGKSGKLGRDCLTSAARDGKVPRGSGCLKIAAITRGMQSNSATGDTAMMPEQNKAAQPDVAGMAMATVLLAVAAVILVMVIHSMLEPRKEKKWNSPDNPITTSNASEEINARAAAWMAVEQRLAPRPATFPFSGPSQVTGSRGQYTVSGPVTTENVFGATERRTFRVRIERSGGGWSVLELDIY